MEIQLRSVGTSNIGFVFPEEMLTQLDLKLGNVCTFASVEDGIKLTSYDLESEQIKTAYQQGKIGYVSTISQIGFIGIGVSVPQEILEQFDLKRGDVIPLIEVEDCLQLMATRKQKSPRRLILKDKNPAEKRFEASQEKQWRERIRNPGAWWLRDDDRWMQ